MTDTWGGESESKSEMSDVLTKDHIIGLTRNGPPDCIVIQMNRNQPMSIQLSILVGTLFRNGKRKINPLRHVMGIFIVSPLLWCYISAVRQMMRHLAVHCARNPIFVFAFHRSYIGSTHKRVPQTHRNVTGFEDRIIYWAE
jgi:hypothetical protein